MMIEVLVKDNVGKITINRPDRHNALNAEGYAALRDSVRYLASKEEVYVVVIEGKGKSFCAGSDLNEFLNKDQEALCKHFEVVSEVFKGISLCKKPVICSIQGYALGGGCALSAAADFSIASEDAIFGLPEVDVGLFPMTIMPVIIRAAGMRKGLELLFLGERIGAEEAKTFGLINRVVKKEQLQYEVEKLASKLASINPFAIQKGKEAYQISQSMEYFTSIDYLYNIMAMVTKSNDAKEAITKFLQRKNK